MSKSYNSPTPSVSPSLTIRLLYIAASFIFALILILSAPSAQAKIETGTSVPDMVMTDSNGVVHNLSDYAGQTVILEWTNHDCPYVKKHYSTDNMQNLQKMATAKPDTVWLSVISSAPGKQGFVSGPQANALSQSRGATPSGIILDPSGDMGRTFQARTTPHMFIIDPAQTLVYQGAIDDNRSSSPKSVEGATNYVRAALDDLEAGRPLVTAETAPYGCQVKYNTLNWGR